MIRTLGVPVHRSDPTDRLGGDGTASYEDQQAGQASLCRDGSSKVNGYECQRIGTPQKRPNPGRLDRWQERQPASVRCETLNPGAWFRVGGIHPDETVPRRGQAVINDREMLARRACPERWVNWRAYVHVERDPERVEQPPWRVPLVTCQRHICAGDSEKRLRSHHASILETGVTSRLGVAYRGSRCTANGTERKEDR